MKKLLSLIIICLLLFFVITPTTVLARAGGSMGSSSSSTSSSDSGSSYSDNNNYYYNNYGDNRSSLVVAIFIGAVGLVFIRSYRKKNRENYTLPETYDELTPELKSNFKSFFYKLEDAWAKNDLNTLKTLMSSKYYSKQKRIINSYVRNHKRDQLDGLVIIDLQQIVDTPRNKIQIIVTAQACDYFFFEDETDQYNQQIQDDTNIERFEEIWTLDVMDDNLFLCDIKVIG